MEPTEYLRFVERQHEFGGLVMTRSVLQQWWQRTTMEGQPPGEWRDVPLQPETNERPC